MNLHNVFPEACVLLDLLFYYFSFKYNVDMLLHRAYLLVDLFLLHIFYLKRLLFLKYSFFFILFHSSFLIEKVVGEDAKVKAVECERFIHLQHRYLLTYICFLKQTRKNETVAIIVFLLSQSIKKNYLNTSTVNKNKVV